MPILHDPYADIDRLRWALTFLGLIAILLSYSFLIAKLPKFWKFRAFNSAEVFVLAFFISIPCQLIPVPFYTKDPHVKAANYRWPNGCEQKYYKWLAPISRACGAEYYEIKNYRDYGLFTNSKHIERGYFRVGNDALLIECFSGSFKPQACEVAEVKRNFFYQ